MTLRSFSREQVIAAPSRWAFLPAAIWFAGVIPVLGSTPHYSPGHFSPPPPAREFRGAWIATVGNIDWPPKPGLPVAEQKSELLALLDRAAQLKLNAIIFQVRPACDAMYASALEPWSEYLNGTMGQPPEPFYDPLAFVVAQAHQRGLELHAWFNPYRAGTVASKSPVAANHVRKTHPQLVREYGKFFWLDPGEREVQEHSLRVVMDVVKRYDVDGVHFDDYFYPYKESIGGRELDFPDDASWRKFGAGGRLSRDDWRRENVNRFIQRVYQSIKATKPWVKFGISPFGIWRPGNPPQIKGLDAYADLYADSRKWLDHGWLDYCAPQLYWAIAPKEQSFPALLDWWNDQNPKRRHLWPGLSTAKARSRWKPDEIPNQIRLARDQRVSAGHIHWNLKSLVRNLELQATLERGLYAEAALIPASKWLDSVPPGKPSFNSTTTSSDAVKLIWSPGNAEPVRWWLLQTRRGQQWTTAVFPAHLRTHSLRGGKPDAIALSAVDRVGNVSSAATRALRK